MNRENNSAEMCESSCSYMGDVNFMAGTDIIGAVDYSANFPKEDFVITDPLWADGCATYGQQLPEQYHIHEAYPQVLDIPQTSSFSQTYLLIDNYLDFHVSPKIKSAFSDYKKDSTKEIQFCLAPTMKQKSLKRCFDFLKRVHINSRERLSCHEADRGRLVEDSYPFTHRIAERNRRNKLTQQFLALSSLLPHNPKKVDKISTLTNAIKELNRHKLRIEELEQLNQSLTSAVRGNSVSEGCSSLSYDSAEDSRNILIEGTISSKRKGERWEANKGKKIKRH